MRRSDTGEGAARVPRRPYGRQGDQLSVVGFGGLVVSNGW